MSKNRLLHEGATNKVTLSLHCEHCGTDIWLSEGDDLDRYGECEMRLRSELDRVVALAISMGSDTACEYSVPDDHCFTHFGHARPCPWGEAQKLEIRLNPDLTTGKPGA